MTPFGLSLIKKQRIYLLRERTEYNIENIDCKYIYFDIKYLKESLLNTIKKDNFKVNDETILNDYLFICFFYSFDPAGSGGFPTDFYNT